MQPSTVASRRATWGEYAEQLVADLRRAARGEGGELWRIAYLAGTEARLDQQGWIHLRTARIRPHLPNTVVLVPEREASQSDMDAIAWHMDQDARTGDIHPEERGRLPAGALLVDPLLAALFEEAGMDEDAVRCWCEDKLHDRKDGGTREIPLRIAGRATAAWANLEFHMNEVRAGFTMTGAAETSWKGGYLSVATGKEPMPEALMIAMRGKPLSDIVDHPLIHAAGEILVTGASHVGDRLGIMTDARSLRRLRPISRRRAALAA